MLKVENLKVHGLPPLSFEVADGACLTVEGPSGSGKTVLLRAIADLDPADGHVFLDGVERGEMPAPLWRRRVRYVAAEARWWGPTAAAHFPDPRATHALLIALGLAPACLDKPIDVLSTGERQRLALVRALLDNPAVLLLDEPTPALDAERRAMVEAVITSRLDAGACVLLVSHAPEQIARLSDARLQLGPTARAAEPAQDMVPS